MITEEILLQNEYKKFKNTWAKNTELNTYICSYQKRFDDEIGKKYFITLDLHDYSRLTSQYAKSWSVNVQFYISGERHLKLSILYMTILQFR